MKKLIYYGVEKDNKYEFPSYTKGLWSHTLKEDENESMVREIIENRCKSNPDCNFMPHVFGGLHICHFQWVN